MLGIGLGSLLVCLTFGSLAYGKEAGDGRGGDGPCASPLSRRRYMEDPRFLHLTQKLRGRLSLTEEQSLWARLPRRSCVSIQEFVPAPVRPIPVSVAGRTHGDL